jgi:hypothetical protein
VASPLQDERRLQCGGDEYGALPVRFDELDLALALERLRDAQADVATPGNHHPTYRLERAAQLPHDHANVFLGGQQEDFVTLFDDRLAGRRDRTVAAIDGGDPPVDLGRQVAAHFPDRAADQKAAGVGTKADEDQPAVAEGQDLQGFGEVDEARDVFGDHLFRTQGIVDGEVLRRQQFLAVQEVARA